MMTTVESNSIRMRYFTKSDLQELHQKATLENRVDIVPTDAIEKLQDNTCYPIFNNSIQDEIFTVKIALNEQGTNVKATMTPEEFEALPVKTVTLSE